MNGFIAVRLHSHTVHAYFTVPDADSRTAAIKAALGTVRDAALSSPEATLMMLLRELTELCDGAELFFYLERLVATPAETMADDYPLLDIRHMTVSWYSLNTGKLLADRISWANAAEAPTAA